MVSSISSSYNYSSYASNMNNMQNKIQNKISENFQKFDTDKSGSLSSDEFSSLLDEVSEATGLSINKEETLSKVDTDSDGAISEKEFASLVKETAPPPPPPPLASLADMLMSEEDTAMGLVGAMDDTDSEDNMQSLLDMLLAASKEYAESDDAEDLNGDGSIDEADGFMNIKNIVMQYVEEMVGALEGESLSLTA